MNKKPLIFKLPSLENKIGKYPNKNFLKKGS
jgi:hypothetical protein